MRRCRLDFPQRAEANRALVGFTVNINILGAYVAAEAGSFPALGEAVVCHVNTADNAIEMPIGGTIAWVNAHQPHPVHSLPPGFGIKFENLADDNKRRIMDVVDEYLRRHPHQAR